MKPAGKEYCRLCAIAGKGRFRGVARGKKPQAMLLGQQSVAALFLHQQPLVAGAKAAMSLCVNRISKPDSKSVMF
ncbi:hypothetical protein C4K33_3232 [Pseudomonas chlororaphis subsp. piscium]|nr:hypothetical protein C4K33_3232 [Pseudomonas chlororaphis subsp. piscium]AZC69962.1 hypothetical protein C4K32_3300 [Pseudomonas chlororaphis subsp. piscium]